MLLRFAPAGLTICEVTARLALGAGQLFAAPMPLQPNFPTLAPGPPLPGQLHALSCTNLFVSRVTL